MKGYSDASGTHSRHARYGTWQQSVTSAGKLASVSHEDNHTDHSWRMAVSCLAISGRHRDQCAVLLALLWTQAVPLPLAFKRWLPHRISIVGIKLYFLWAMISLRRQTVCCSVLAHVVTDGHICVVNYRGRSTFPIISICVFCVWLQINKYILKCSTLALMQHPLSVSGHHSVVPQHHLMSRVRADQYWIIWICRVTSSFSYQMNGVELKYY